MSSRPVLSVAIVIAVVATACGGSAKRSVTAPPSTTSSTAPATIPFTQAEGPSTTVDSGIKLNLAFAPCKVEPTFQCAIANPPMDYANPNGPKDSV